MADETYTYIPPPPVPGFSGSIQKGANTFIPLNLENADYQAFLAWMAEGNPAPEGWSGPTNASG